MPDLVTSATPNRPRPSDDLLAARAASGDVRAFAILVERHRATVPRVAARLVGPDDAGDVAQDAFLRAFHRLDRLRRVGPSGPGSCASSSTRRSTRWTGDD